MLASGVCNIWLGCKFCVELLGFFDKFNTDKALCIYGTILIVFRE